jgi:hypothetical protein
MDRQAVENIARQNADNTALVPANPRDDASTLASPPTFPIDSLPDIPEPFAWPPVDRAPPNPRTTSSFLQNWKRRFNSTMHLNNSEKGLWSQENVDGPPSILDYARPTRGGQNVTPLSNICTNCFRFTLPKNLYASPTSIQY